MARSSQVSDLVRFGITGTEWLRGLTPGTPAYQEAEQRFLTGSTSSLAQELQAHIDDAEQAKAIRNRRPPRKPYGHVPSRRYAPGRRAR